MSFLRTVPVQQKYGLVKKMGSSKPSTSAVPLNAKKVSNVFRAADDSDDDDDDGDNAHGAVTRVNRILLQKSAAAQKEERKLHDDALGEDPNVFDYDGVYDTMKAAEVTTHALSRPQEKDAPKARYVHNLMATATVREKEKDRIFERKLLKDRKQEDEQYGDKPKFVTAAYKQKLMETQKWEHEDKLADEIEQRSDVRTQGMSGFYSNLLNKNVAMGADVESSALSAYTAGSNRQTKHLESSSSSSSSAIVSQHKPAVRDDDGDDDNYERGRKRSYSIHSDGDGDIDHSSSTKTARIESSDSISAPPETIPTPNEPLPSKDEQISLARQRFLERRNLLKQ